MMTMNKLIEKLIDANEINKIKYQIEEYSPLYVQGLSEGIKPHLALSIFDLLDKNIVLIAENEKKAQRYWIILSSL